MAKTTSFPHSSIEGRILILRGQRVMLDSALAADETESLRSQFVILKKGRGEHSKYLPQAFTEQGIAMLSSVLRSKRAILVNIEIMRAFVRLRQFLSTNAELARRLEALEKKYDAQFKVVFDAIRDLMAPIRPRSRPIGFVTPREG